MKKTTWKLVALTLGAALFFGLAGTAAAIDGTSLPTRTTEGLYDRTAPYDLAMWPAYTYQLDRWRLDTNLTGYSGPGNMSSDSYMIGVTGPLGPGSMGFFYETNKDEVENRSNDTAFYYEEYDWGTTYPNYTGNWDYLTNSDYSTVNMDKDKENNFYAVYGMDFDWFSLGLSYAPEFGNEENTLNFNMSDPQGDLSSASTSARTVFLNEWFWGWTNGTWNGNNYDNNQSSTMYSNEAHTQYDTLAMTESFNGTRERDTKEHPIYLQGKFDVLSDDFFFVAGFGYEKFKTEDTVNGRYNYTYSMQSTTTTSTTRDYSFDMNGSGNNTTLDSDEYGFYLEPNYKWSDLISLRMNMAYYTSSGDTNMGVTGKLTGNETRKLLPTSNMETWTLSENWDGTGIGTLDSDRWMVEPRIYLTFDRVRFAMGVGYYESKITEDTTRRNNKSATYTYDDGSGVADAADWTMTGSWIQTEVMNEETKMSSWRFPVAVEMDFTDKVIVRAGASYERAKSTTDGRVTDTGKEDELYTATDGTGTKVYVGSAYPQGYWATTPPAPGDVGNAYQNYSDGETETYTSERTWDWTEYNIGLTYLFTENFRCDLMWTGKGNDGGVDISEVFASGTLAFGKR